MGQAIRYIRNLCWENNEEQPTITIRTSRKRGSFTKQAKQMQFIGPQPHGNNTSSPEYAEPAQIMNV